MKGRVPEMKWVYAVDQIEQAIGADKVVYIRFHKKYKPDDWCKHRVMYIRDGVVVCSAFRCSPRITNSTHIIDEVIVK